MAFTFLRFITLHSSPPLPHPHQFPPNPSIQFFVNSSPKLRSVFKFPLKPSLLLLSCSPEPPLSSMGSEEDTETDSDSGDGIEIEVVKVGRNRRRVSATVGVGASLETVWGVLTDYEGLAEFIPSLSVCQLLEKGNKFAKLYQVGQQDLALGVKFNAKAILDCYEKDLELLPSGRRRNIEFRMVEGDFQTLDGIWSIEENNSEKCEDEILVEQEYQTMLSYVVEVEPKLWLPVRFLEGRICKEVRNNLSSVREEAQRIQKVLQATEPSW